MTNLTLYHTIPLSTTLRYKPFENIVGKGENAGNQHFPLFPQSFLPIPKQISIFKVPIAANKKEFVYIIKEKPIHTILKYGDYHDFMDR